MFAPHMCCILSVFSISGASRDLSAGHCCLSLQEDSLNHRWLVFVGKYFSSKLALTLYLFLPIEFFFLAMNSLTLQIQGGS